MIMLPSTSRGQSKVCTWSQITLENRPEDLYPEDLLKTLLSMEKVQLNIQCFRILSEQPAHTHSSTLPNRMVRKHIYRYTLWRRPHLQFLMVSGLCSVGE